MARRLWCLAILAIGAACGRGEAPPARDSAASVRLTTLAGFADAKPVDEATKDPTLVAARDSLIAIATRRDSAALHAMLHPTIKFSFGDSRGGPPAFFAHWKQHHSMEALWTVLRDVLEHGGRLADGKSFRAPWTFEALPPNLDAFEYLVVRDSGAKAWATADSSGKPVGSLSHTIVRAVYEQGTDSTWRGVRLPDGRTVFVPARHVRSPVDFRIGLTKYGTRWMIDFFVAGD